MGPVNGAWHVGSAKGLSEAAEPGEGVHVRGETCRGGCIPCLRTAERQSKRAGSGPCLLLVAAVIPLAGESRHRLLYDNLGLQHA